MQITEFMGKVTEVWLMHQRPGHADGDAFLAKNKIGPFHAAKGDKMKFAFSVNTKLVEPQPCAPEKQSEGGLPILQ
jgi:hypothetical protein